MNEKRKINIESFVEEAEKIRKRPISKKDIDRINEISRRVEIEENEDDQEFELPIAAKENGESTSTQL